MHVLTIRDLKSMKATGSLSRIILSLLLLFINATSLSATSPKSKPQDFRVEGYITNMLTGAPLAEDITVEILQPDSTVIATGTSFYGERSSGLSNFFNISAKGTGEEFILRLSHPDFDTVTRNFSPKAHLFDAGITEMRRLSKFEKSRMLGEVTVTASIVQFVNKGDTIQYNADAFKMAQGSMLDALLEKMPGVEINSDGQITVNGRFVEKLLLDGKDFFQGDKLVLLQNLPAYTVKNIQVYEKANEVAEVLGPVGAGRDQYQYVMDVKLKKDYNAGWMANAEAGAGTHDRYRGRAFGLGYTKSLRLSAYGFINNLNETRNPGRNGNWEPADTKNGITSSKGGGINYGVYRGQKLEVTGDVTASYTHTDFNSRIMRQNFLTGGDTYTRRWNNSLDRELNLKTSHFIILRPETGNKYNTRIELYGQYGDKKRRSDATEGTFSRLPQEGNELKEQLTLGMPDGSGIINRYIDYVKSRQREWGGSWQHNSTFRIKDSSTGVTFSSHGFYYRGLGDATSDYLLQYADGNPEKRDRLNPTHNHRYEYWVGGNMSFNLSSTMSLTPSVGFCHDYYYNDNTWLTETDETDDTQREYMAGVRSDNPDAADSRRMLERLMRLDPRNSYVAGLQHNHEYLSLYLNFFKEERRDGQSYSLLSMNFNATANINQDHYRFNGGVSRYLKKNYTTPSASFTVFWSPSKRIHTFELKYYLDGQRYDMLDLIDHTFDTDPLNLRTGNPDLRQTIRNSLQVRYNSNKLWTSHLLNIFTNLGWRHNINDVVMSYDYDRATGVRTFRPANVNGNHNINYQLGGNLYLDRARKWWIYNSLNLGAGRLTDLMSTDGFNTFDKKIINTFSISDNMGIEYDFRGHTIGANAGINRQHSSSTKQDFTPFDITTFKYGGKCRFVLPYKIELSSDLTMYSNRGYDYHEMNTNQLVWNGRISKPIMKGNLIMAIDGYDILGNVKSISYMINGDNRTETWVNNIPSYVMLSLRWNFTKKPRE